MFPVLCDEYDSQDSQNLSMCTPGQPVILHCSCFTLNAFKLMQAKVAFVKISKVTFLLSSLKEEVKNGVSAPDGKKREKKKIFYLCTSFCKLNQHRPMGNQCTDCCCECQWNVWRCNPKNAPTWLQTQTNRSKWGQTHTHTHTLTYIQGQLNKKQINRVSFR